MKEVSGGRVIWAAWYRGRKREVIANRCSYPGKAGAQDAQPPDDRPRASIPESPSAASAEQGLLQAPWGCWMEAKWAVSEGGEPALRGSRRPPPGLGRGGRGQTCAELSLGAHHKDNKLDMKRGHPITQRRKERLPEGAGLGQDGTGSRRMQGCALSLHLQAVRNVGDFVFQAEV